MLGYDRNNMDANGIIYKVLTVKVFLKCKGIWK